MPDFTATLEEGNGNEKGKGWSMAKPHNGEPTSDGAGKQLPAASSFSAHRQHRPRETAKAVLPPRDEDRHEVTGLTRVARKSPFTDASDVSQP